ncbi:MAG: type II toxin-antitoxin system RelE/ParE family toxin [Candidatus Eisenbacteria bacterium]|nr:type II toxin-antitoxin system RelE/ParE family toxin [Candidatus Eisenbacteria bacterium]
MPRTEVLLYREEDGTVPLIDWLDGLSPKAQAKCLARLKRLEDLGHELRRPEADVLRDGIYELRTKEDGLNYRMLYFFHGRQVVVLSHGFVKQEAQVPERELRTALQRKARFEQNPRNHTFRPEK